MNKRILVIGGTRYFGKQIVSGLVAQGHDVTVLTRGRTPDVFGNSVRRLAADRTDASALKAALAGTPDFDVVIDQMCYTPLDAMEAVEIFDGRTDRYVMASTIEVYTTLAEHPGRPYCESDIELGEIEADLDLPWRSPGFVDQFYALGKVRAEAVFAREARFKFASVRLGHVLSAVGDFTGRLDPYIDMAIQGRDLHTPYIAQPSSFVAASDAASFMRWIALGDELGAFNAASSTGMSAVELYRQICHRLGVTPVITVKESTVTSSDAGLAFMYCHAHEMSMQRANRAGFAFSPLQSWMTLLVDAICERALYDRRRASDHILALSKEVTCRFH